MAYYKLTECMQRYIQQNKWSEYRGKKEHYRYGPSDMEVVVIMDEYGNNDRPDPVQGHSFFLRERRDGEG